MTKRVTVTLRSGERVEFVAESVEMKNNVLTWTSLEDDSQPTLVALDQDAVVAVVAAAEVEPPELPAGATFSDRVLLEPALVRHLLKNEHGPVKVGECRYCNEAARRLLDAEHGSTSD